MDMLIPITYCATYLASIYGCYSTYQTNKLIKLKKQQFVKSAFDFAKINESEFTDKEKYLVYHDILTDSYVMSVFKKHITFGFEYTRTTSYNTDNKLNSSVSSNEKINNNLSFKLLSKKSLIMQQLVGFDFGMTNLIPPKFSDVILTSENDTQKIKYVDINSLVKHLNKTYNLQINPLSLPGAANNSFFPSSYNIYLTSFKNERVYMYGQKLNNKFKCLTLSTDADIVANKTFENEEFVNNTKMTFSIIGTVVCTCILYGLTTN